MRDGRRDDGLFARAATKGSLNGTVRDEWTIENIPKGKKTMRSLPRSTRIAIATLYIRMRDARRRETRMRLTMGIGSAQALKARGETIESSNALQAVIGAVRDDLRFPSPTAFVDLTARRGKVLSKAA